MNLPKLVLILGATFAVASALVVSANSGHRRRPSPDGLVFRVEARSGGGVFDGFAVTVASLDPPLIAVEFEPTRSLYRYPTGELVRVEPCEHVTEPTWTPDAAFDFDGDGAEDQLLVLTLEGIVRVVSGATGDVLFEDIDPLEYEDGARGFPLGDLDHDGCAELALFHPRKDRSKYDFELWDRLLGAHSWVTVVSGSRIAAKPPREAE